MERGCYAAAMTSTGGGAAKPRALPALSLAFMVVTRFNERPDAPGLPSYPPFSHVETISTP